MTCRDRPARRASAMSALFAAGLLLSGGAETRAQDRFGAAVAVTESGEVLAVKPAFAHGPAALFAFARSADGTWSKIAELRSEGTALRGEEMGASLSAPPWGALVASGDPGLRVAAYGFERTGDGWAEGPALPLGGSGAAPGAVSLETVMAILQPSPRVVAASEADALVAVLGGAEAGVRAYRRGPGGAWREIGRLEAEGVRGADRFGAALAVRGDRAAVGAPRHEGAGAVFLFDRSEDGWRWRSTLRPPEGVPGDGFGAALAWVGEDELVVGSPAAAGSEGRIHAFVREAEGSWHPSTLAPPVRADGQAFGAALASDGRWLLVGAPGVEEGRGRVEVFARADGVAGDGPRWTHDRSVVDDSLPPRSFLGSSVAVAAGRAALGAPGADGNAGRVAVVEWTEEGWSAPAWLRAVFELPAVAGESVVCEEGRAAGFACSDVDLEAFLPLSAIGAAPGERVSDAWGWTDPATGREYALVGRTAGAAILDVTDASRPVYLGVVRANPSGARDLKVYREHLFFTGDGAGDHGLVVFDLRRLRDLPGPPGDLEPDARFDGIGSAHNLILDTESGMAFTVSTSGAGETCGGGLLMIDVRVPVEPRFAGCYTDTEGLLFPGRTHDAQCVVYRGPDEDHRGRELCFASNETALRIVDVTDPRHPVPISAAAYPGAAYIHQGWLTEDQRYFYLDDELDELVGTTERTRTIIWDLSDLDDPVVAGEFLGPGRSTDHNLYVRGDRMYQANYQAGLRVIDVADPEHPREVGFFDTTPWGADPPGFNGAWTAFPFFESGTVLVTSMNEGVFLLRPRRAGLVP